MLSDHADLLKKILSAQLGPSYPPSFFTERTPLLGSIPELDSMAVVGILTAIEEELGITIPDDEISAEAFATFADLESLVTINSARG
jgi:acyl carrier protein